MEKAQTAATEKDPRTRHGAAWGMKAPGEPRWPASLAILIALALNVTLPQKLTFGPVYLVPVLVFGLLLPLIVVAPLRIPGEVPAWARVVAISLIGVITLSNIVSLGLLVSELISSGHHVLGGKLLLGAVQIWVTNIIIFALWYWELDRGGPAARLSAQHSQPDFLFPQMVTPGSAPAGWGPKFMDYLFVSFTNATAFSPTDTMPLTAWAKMLMLVQAATSLLTVALVAARAVNILD